MKRKNLLIMAFVTVLLIIGIIGFIINSKNTNNLFEIFSSKLANSGQASSIQYLVYDNQNESSLKVLVKIMNDRGIEYIQREDGSKIICNNKKEVAFDIELPLNVSKGNIQVKTIYGLEQKEMLITENDMESQLEISVEKPDKDGIDNTTKIYTFYDMKKNTDKTYYKLNESDEWTIYNDKFVIDDSIEETNIFFKKEDLTGNILYFNKQAHINIPDFVSIGDIVWQDEKASVTITKGPEIIPNTTIEYLIKANKQSKWTKMNENEETLTDILNGNVVFIRLLDENNKVQAVVSETILDKTSPKDARVQYTKLKNGGTGEEYDINPLDEIITITAGDIVKANITLEDEETGINLQNCRWQFTTKKTPIGIETYNYPYENSFINNTIEIQQQLIGTDGARYLHILSCDKAGNYKETIITNPIVNVTGGDGLDVFSVVDASKIFDDVTGYQIGPIYKENYKVGASINRDGAGWFSDAYGNWSTKINASSLYNELNIEEISKFNVEFTYEAWHYNGGRNLSNKRI